MSLCELLLVVLLFIVTESTRTREVSSITDHGNSERLYLKLISHKPCQWNKNNVRSGKWIQKIRFPSFNEAPLIEDKERPGCYKIGGSVWVKKIIQGTLQLHLELKHRSSKEKAPEACFEPHPETGCGGFGSCLYCDTCQHQQTSINKALQLTRASIEINGKPLRCGKALRRGVHRNTYLHFCLPSKEEFFKAQGISEDVWDDIVESRNDDGKQGKIGIFMNIRIFNSKVNKLMISQRKLEVYQRQRLGLSEFEPLPSGVYQKLPFNRLLDQEKGFIGCHRVFGNVFLKDKNE